MNQKTIRAALALGVAAAPGLLSADARACGGTFCDSAPQAMPVDQTGENILFVVDGGYVEAHVQIQYSGDPERFAWVVPIPAVPEVRVGSEALFQNLLGATVPSFGVSFSRDFCAMAAGAGGSTGTGGAAASGGAPSGAADAGVQVVFQRTVGAFEVTALQGRSATEVVDWLVANDYQTVDTAPALLEKYVRKGSVFAAVKLTAGAGTDQIHPLVFRYAGDEPCIPLELTAVAAAPDMGVRAFFLGDSRVASTNYADVVPNLARLDWASSGSNYLSLVSRAVDEAGGHGFVTEYAGRSSIVPAPPVDPSWNDDAFVRLDAAGAVRELQVQGLLSCDWSACWAAHPLILPLLREALPPPAGVEQATYLACLAFPESCLTVPLEAGAGDGGAPGFDAVAFARALEERVFQPARAAQAMLLRYPYLTRLFTTISPGEMTLDPFFEARPALAESPLLQSFASIRITESGDRGATLPDGTVVALAPDGGWPLFTGEMPWALSVTHHPAGQPSRVERDDTAKVDGLLDAWNARRGWPPPPLECPGQGGGGGAGGGGAGAGGAPGSGGAFGWWGAGELPATPGSGARSATGGAGARPGGGTGGSRGDSGCSLSGGGSGSSPEGLLALAALALLRRRRADR